MSMKNIYKKGELVYFLGHKLKIIKATYHSFGYYYHLSCYSAGCCTVPNILELTISEKDLIKLITQGGKQ